MITRIAGTLLALDEFTAIVQPAGVGAFSLEILIPAFLEPVLRERIGAPVEFATLFYLESQNQGASYAPRLIGFQSVPQRDFFELFTTVKGIGNRKALRAMAEPPAVIAAAIVARNTRALTELPEIGKRMAETVIAELSGKVETYLADADAMMTPKPLPPRAGPRHPPGLEEAIAALVGLGESRVEAERLVLAAAGRLEDPAPDVERLLAAVYAAR